MSNAFQKDVKTVPYGSRPRERERENGERQFPFKSVDVPRFPAFWNIKIQGIPETENGERFSHFFFGFFFVGLHVLSG